jgi:hypothetical protein
VPCNDGVVGSFDNAPETWQRPDWNLLQNGFVTLFMDPQRFVDAKRDLTGLGYLVVELDAGIWDTTEAALVDIGRAFAFPDYYGRNVNALVNCL